MRDKIPELMRRLLSACNRLPDMGGDLWGRGVDALERKFGARIWLSSFVPQGFVSGESPTAEVTFTPSDVLVEEKEITKP